MWIPDKLKQIIDRQRKSTQFLAEIAAGMDNQQRLLNDKLTEAIVALNDITNELRSKPVTVATKSNGIPVDTKLDVMIARPSNQTPLVDNQPDFATMARADRSPQDNGELKVPSQRETAANSGSRYIIKSLLATPTAVRISWADDHESLYHHIWLRDNCA